ncbi:MAG: tetratricopeptide repeat-containing protein, partial [Pseudomonadota bacterium]
AASLTMTVDFDALWEHDIRPALDSLGYTPIRGTSEIGGVISKSILEQVVFADLVIADISINNGSVYYQAGVRHAARSQGCVLICADWGRPLFGVRQPTQLRYPFGSSSNGEPNYADIRHSLVNGIPALARSVGPVFELFRNSEPDTVHARQLIGVSAALFDFQTRLRTARIQASAGDKAPLRALIAGEEVSRLPDYAVADLVRAVKDNLEWHQLSTLLDNLGAVVKSDPYLMEQKALAIGKMGNISEGIGLLEQIVEDFGESPKRMGMIGDSYHELARNESKNGAKRRNLSRAIEAYERGMLLDLNLLYCAQKSIVAHLERDHPGDREKADSGAKILFFACARARELNLADEWLYATLLVHAFFVEDYETAQQLVSELLAEAWSNWRLMSLTRDLESIVHAMVNDDGRERFEYLINEIREVLPVSQDTLLATVGPRFEERGHEYRRSLGVWARPAIAGEVVTSVTEVGEETTSVADATDFLVGKEARGGELYIVGNATFNKRYDPADDDREVDGMRRYLAKGRVIAVEASQEITTALDVGSEFCIRAPWGEVQYAREGDYLVMPLPAKGEIYRMDRLEFEITYVLAED